MDKLFLTILNMSLTGAFVIAAICLARLPLKKAPKIISYCLWAVAGFRLVFPFSIEGVFSLIPFKAQTIPPDIAMQPIPRIDSGIPFVNNAVSGILPAATPTASVNPLQIWTAIGAWVWIIGVAVLLIYGVVSFIILKRKMSEAAHIEANVYEAENIKSPFVLGIFKPRIYLPTDLSEQEKNYIILHEQTHIRRHDHIVKFAAYFILCLHWFNPFTWVAFLLMGVDMEMSCDERVLKEMGGETKKDYSLSLLSLATERRIIGGSPLAFGEGGIKERVKNVLNFKKTSRVVIVAAVVLAAVLSVGFAVNRMSGHEPFTLGAYITDDGLTQTVFHDNHEFYIVRHGASYSPVGAWVYDTEPNDNKVILICADDERYVFSYQANRLTFEQGAWLENWIEPGTVFTLSEGTFDGEDMTLDDVRELAAKSDDLLFEDLRQYKGMNASSNFDYYIMVYGVEGGYRLVVHSNATGKPDSISLESIWESGGSGIDIRYGGIDEFINAHPSHPALTSEETLAIAQDYTGKALTLIDVDWWEYADEFPHHSKDPDKQALNESLDAITEPYDLFIDTNGAFVAIGRKYGTIFTYSNGKWNVLMAAPTDLETAISEAILESNKNGYRSGDFTAEAHTILAIAEEGNKVTVYLMALYQVYGYSGGGFSELGGSHMPVAISFDKEADGDYIMTEYWTPRDGTYYAPSIREKFPQDIYEDAIDTQKYIYAHVMSCYEQAIEYGDVDADYQIASLIETICSSPREASNSEAYIEAHSIKFRELVYFGRHTLDYCFNLFEKRDQTGLEGHIMAAACRDIMSILGIEVMEGNFNTGQDWYDAQSIAE